jgi:ferritin
MDQIITRAIDLLDSATAAFVGNLAEEQTEEEATASELLERTLLRYTGPANPNIQLRPIDYNLP